MTNKEIIYNAFINAQSAYFNTMTLRDKLEELMGEKFPLTAKLYEITEDLDDVSNIHYELGYGGHVDFDTFDKWLSDERELGQCKNCANRVNTNEQGFHRCTLSRGLMSPDYCCYDYKPLE